MATAAANPIYVASLFILPLYAAVVAAVPPIAATVAAAAVAVVVTTLPQFLSPCRRCGRVRPLLPTYVAVLRCCRLVWQPLSLPHCLAAAVTAAAVTAAVTAAVFPRRD